MDLMDYRRKIIANSPHLMSASGAVVSFSDGADLPLKSLLVNIEPVQSGTGDPSPSNIRPISGWNAVKVTRCGINKLPPMVDGTYTGNGLTAVVKDGVATLSGTSTASGNALIIPLAEEYTVTEGYLHLCNSVANASFAPTFEDVNAISASNVSYACSPVNRVSAIPSNRIGQKWNRIRVWISSGVTISGTYAPMVCADNTVRQYEPYQGQSITVQLGETVYGGTLNPLTGVLTVDKVALVIDGVNIKFNQVAKYGTLNRFGVSYPTGLKAKYSGSTSFCMSDKIKPSWENTVAINTTRPEGYYCFPHSSAFFVSMPSSVIDGTNTSEANAWAETNRPTVCYELDTPYTIQLTPQQVRSLYGSNTIFADTGNVALEYWAHP